MTREPQKGDRETAYQAALDRARGDYARVDKAKAADLAQAVFDAVRDVVTVPFIGTAFEVSQEGMRIIQADDGRDARPVEQILILHYLATASGRPPAGRAVAFREIPGGAFYHTTFHAHTVMELIRAFGNDEALFEKASMGLGAVREAGSGVRMRFEAFPRVPVTLCYWAGEEEMPAGAQVLFDVSVTAYLPLEDIAVLGETLVHRVLIRAGAGGAASLYEYGE
jgi:hypothetical protein